MDSLTPDQAAAHEFLAQLRTRITTQPLPYQYGVEAKGLESLWGLFEHARDIIARNPGCVTFATRVTEMLNLKLRPVTSKWHHAHEKGLLDSNDGADEFRGDLQRVQKDLREFAREMHLLAYGAESLDDLAPAPMDDAQMAACFGDVPFGLHPGTRDLDDALIERINHDEATEIMLRRTNHGIVEKPGMNAVGIAFSGGGIRSATFCLGITQVLAERNLLKDADYLSTVSGGGYTGSFISVLLGSGKATSANIDDPHGPDPWPIRHVRHHAKFLNPVNLKDRWAMITGTLSGMLLNWTAPALMIVLAAMWAVVVGRYDSTQTLWPTTIKYTGAFTGLALLAYCGLLRETPKAILWGARVLGWSSAITVLALLFWIADWGYGYFKEWINTDLGPRRLSAAGVLTAMVAAGPAIMGFFPLLSRPLVRVWTMKILLWLAGAVIPVLALFAFYLARHIGDLPAVDDLPLWHPASHGGVGVLACIALICGLLGVVLLNVNLTAPHRIYRDRLAKTFIQVGRNSEQPVPLTEINPTHLAPYHLINTTLNLPSSELPALRDRRCAFFLFSKHWTGAATTGYHPTADWKTNGRPVDLATAMAVSGAAASSYMGILSMPTLTALLTFLNVRLGFWIRQPGKWAPSESAGFLCLLREMIGFDMHEKSTWLNLSDGGHIENTALYELLRRRCKFMISVDAEADPGYTFGGLMTLVRHAQIDLGVRIEPDLSGLRPAAASGHSQSHALMCRVYYPAIVRRGAVIREAATGLLLYLKLSLTGNESELINRYRGANPTFPHESTADQFFDEAQFEAYRQLGVHVMQGLFSPAVTNGLTRPPSVRAWFEQLARNLLLPDPGCIRAEQSTVKVN